MHSTCWGATRTRAKAGTGGCIHRSKRMREKGRAGVLNRKHMPASPCVSMTSGHNSNNSSTSDRHGNHSNHPNPPTLNTMHDRHACAP
eukprot:124594-Chlamydomonas_euryale.AAC.4